MFALPTVLLNHVCHRSSGDLRGHRGDEDAASAGTHMCIYIYIYIYTHIIYKYIYSIVSDASCFRLRPDRACTRPLVYALALGRAFVL